MTLLETDLATLAAMPVEPGQDLFPRYITLVGKLVSQDIGAGLVSEVPAPYRRRVFMLLIDATEGEGEGEQDDGPIHWPDMFWPSCREKASA